MKTNAQSAARPSRRVSCRWIAWAALALLGDAGASAEQGAPPSAEPQSVDVIGSRASKHQEHHEAVEFVRQSGAAFGQTALARWTGPACPRAYGVDKAVAARVEARMRAIGAVAGVPLGAAHCKPNIAVVFSEDAGLFVRTMMHKEQDRLDQVTPRAYGQLVGGEAPVRWWYTTTASGSDGDQGANSSPVGAGGDGAGSATAIPMNGDTQTIQRYSASLISTQTVRALAQATVVVDVRLAQGKTLDAVAAYAAMVAFAELRPMPASPRGSVLGLFDPAGGADDITDGDRAMLSQIYKLQLDREARHQRGLLVKAVLRERAAAPARGQ